MGELRYESDLLDEVAHRLDLREPNKEAVRSVVLRTSQHYDVDEETTPFECVVDSATGVGKTYVMAGLIEYLAGAQAPARNFLLLTPGRTIRDQSVNNFTPGHGKSLTAAMRSRPFIVTTDNFESPGTRTIMDDPTRTKLYIFTVQALTSATGEGRATHEYQESLGGSFFEYVSELDDLVILADEHHCYRGPAFSRTIKDLNPELVVGMTATPAKADERLIAFRYPLAAAIADRLVKTPVMVGRRDDRNDVETKLLDGVTLLRYKGQVAEAYCDEHGLSKVNPVMLVIARSIDEAEEFQKVLDSVSFDSGAWVNKTLLIHSKLTGDDKESALAALEAVEHSDSPVRIIISVGMLKEGWDVKNVYVIASMRASVSEVMTEQTLGRGMRLPFGKYTDVEILDTVEVLAHEKYEELLEKRKVLNQAFIDYGTYAEIRALADGRQVVRQKAIETDKPVIPPSKPSDQEQSDGEEGMSQISGVVDVATRTQQAAVIAKKTAEVIRYTPLKDREPVVVPRIISKPKLAAVSLNDIDEETYGRFEKLGKALTTDFSDELRRTKITATREGPRAVKVGTETASDRIVSSLSLDIPLEASKHGLLRRVMAVKGVQNRPLEVGAAKRIVDGLVDAMGDEAGAFLSAFGDRAGQRLSAEVSRALSDTSRAQVIYEDEVVLEPLNHVREARKEQNARHADGSFNKATAFNGWDRNLYSHAWFDTTPEFKAANAIDAGKDVVVWARLHINDIPITWTVDGRRYNPDFVVIEEVNGKRIGWLVETKADKDMDSAEVVEKRRAARKWARTVNSSPDVEMEWRYLLLSEQDVDDALGSWQHMKGFGQ
jgi:type III restriction enzyme